jgi:hypothetical protein
MFKSFVKFSLIVMVTMVVTYFLAGLVARFALGGEEFYPPSPTAISYLRDPAGPGMAFIIWPAQALRGLLFALVLFPLRKRFMELGVWAGGLLFGSLIFVMGYVAASGGMIEHFVWFTEYPLKFAMITFIEILIQVAIMGPWAVKWMKQAGLDQELPASPAPGAVQAAYGSK